MNGSFGHPVSYTVAVNPRFLNRKRPVTIIEGFRFSHDYHAIGRKYDSVQEEINRTDFTLRNGLPSDLPFLRAMLFEAAYWRPNQSRPSLKAGLAAPDLSKLLAGWGRKGDTALIAETPNGNPLGAAWFRFWTYTDHSYGFVHPDVPELAIAVDPACRRQGIGRKLLTALFREAEAIGVQRISLSVERDNPALNLYVSEGFKEVGVLGNAYTLIRIIESSTDSQ